MAGELVRQQVAVDFCGLSTSRACRESCNDDHTDRFVVGLASVMYFTSNMILDV